MTNSTFFRPSREAVEVEFSAGETKSFLLPVVDPANPDVQIANHAQVAVFVSFSPGIPVGPGVPDCVVIGAGQVIILTAQNDVLAVAANRLLRGGDQARRAGFTMMGAAWATMAGSLVIYRGRIFVIKARDDDAQTKNAWQPAPATVWEHDKPRPQTDTRTAWPEGWPPVKAL